MIKYIIDDMKLGGKCRLCGSNLTAEQAGDPFPDDIIKFKCPKCTFIKLIDIRKNKEVPK